jgi:hypothetical protein
MERLHGYNWASMVEPITKFVQCFGVSKRPDQYIRFVCGADRIRVWRLNEFIVSYDSLNFTNKLKHFE